MCVIIIYVSELHVVCFCLPSDCLRTYVCACVLGSILTKLHFKPARKIKGSLSHGFRKRTVILLISLNSGPPFQSDVTAVAKAALPPLWKRSRLPKQHLLTPQ